VLLKNDELSDLQNKLTRLLAEQERTRKNLEAAGPQTQQGQNYLIRLAAQDNDIDEAHKAISSVEQAVKDAQHDYEKHISDMYFEGAAPCA
jgi:chromosome segregation ATPase